MNAATAMHKTLRTDSPFSAIFGGANLAVISMVFLLVFFPAISNAADPEPSKNQPSNQDPEWFGCNNTTDCLLVDGHCGRHNAINKKFESNYKTWVEGATNDSECVTPKLKDTDVPIQANDDLKVNCREGQCVVQTEKQQSAQ